MTIHPRRALLRLEVADALRSRWAFFTAVTYLLVFGAFMWLGLRESTVLGFTGVSRVVLNLANVIVVVLPLVALIATSQVVVRGRNSGFFELFLSQPCRRSDWFTAVVVCRLAVIAGPLLLLLLVAVAIALVNAEPGALPLVLRCAGVALSLSFAFVGIGLWLSTRSVNSERATVYALVTWMAVSALHDFALIGLMLQIHLAPRVVFFLAALNPVETARLAILSAVDPELSVLGPVGFWLTNTLGPAWTVALGVGAPALLGVLSTWSARKRIQVMDLIG